MKPTDYDIYMETSRLAVHATTVIERAMKRADLSRSQLADLLDMPRSRVTKVLDGETNMTLRTLASFGLACGVTWQFSGVSLEDGNIALDWRHLEFSAAWVPPTETPESLDAITVAADNERSTLVCSAHRASQDPIGPLLGGSRSSHPSRSTSPYLY